MRITNKMMVTNVKYWLSKQSEKLYDAETIVSTGKQINKPSDDPLAESHILMDRSTLSKYGQYQSNIDLAETWIETSENTLGAVGTFLQDAQDIVSAQESGDTETRNTALDQLQSIYDQIVSLANTQFGSGYLYSGNRTNITPFANIFAVSDGIYPDIEFALTGDASDMTIEITNSTGELVRTLNLSGGSDGNNTVTWDGLDNDGNPLPDGKYDFSVSASNTIGDSVAAYPAYNGDEGYKQVIIGENSVLKLNNNGGKIFGDSLDTLSRLITALEASDYDTELVSELGNSLEEGIDQIDAERVALSNAYSLLATTDDRLDRLTLSIEGRMNDEEAYDADQAVIDLQSRQTSYEIVTESAAQILNLPKLLDYLG